MVQPLEDIKVLDLCKTIGMYSTMILADMGADVVRIEEAPRSPARAITPMSSERMLAFDNVNRNKKAIALNLKMKEGRQIFYELAKTADIIIEDFRPGVTKRLGIDYETVRNLNPRVIFCSISGYGQDGPYRLLPGHDPNYLAVSGILNMTGTPQPDGDYAVPGVQVADLGGGSLPAVVGVLLALIARVRTGKGQYIDIAMTDGMVSWLGFVHGTIYFATGLQPKRGGRPPLVFETKDGKKISICPGEPWLWERLCHTIGLDDYVKYYDVLYANHALRQNDAQLSEKQKKLVPRLAEVFRTKTREEWFRILADADTCVSPVNDLPGVFSDPQVLSRKMVVELDHPTQGKVRQIGIAIKLSDTPGKIRSFAPRYGDHSDEVLLDLGYTKDRIEALRNMNAVT